MKISVIQPDTTWEDKSLNFKTLTSLISPLFNNTDIVILPEMFNTGFSMNVSRLGEDPGGVTFQWMKDMAVKGNFGICGSYIVNENNQYFNRWVFVSPQDEIRKYDKHHLFSMGGEKEFFSPGKSRLSFLFRDIKISAYICYDLRFPVWCRNTEKSDLIIFAANWPESRINVWNTLLAARAIENQCYVAGANRTGTDGSGIVYSGESMIVNPRGEIISSAANKDNCIISAEISRTELADFRQKFPVLDDGDEFDIGKSASESERLQNAFLNNLSHEIRTPLNAIVGFTTLLGEPGMASRRREFMEIVTHSSDHLLEIVDDILEVSKIQTGKVRMVRNETNINEMLIRVFSRFKTSAAAKNINFRYLAHNDENTIINTDGYKLFQALAKLVHNAIKFTHEDGDVEFGFEPGNGTIQFFVSDNGIGIGQEHHPHIFEPFYQAEPANAHKVEGTGLGLTIAKAYIELIGGELWFSSEQGRGSVFRFNIPYF